MSNGKVRRAMMQLESSARNHRMYGAGASRHFGNAARSQRNDPKSLHLPALEIEALERQANRAAKKSNQD